MVNIDVIDSIRSMISRNFCRIKIFRQNAYLVISLVKLLLSRNFCQNCAGVNFRNFHTVRQKYRENISKEIDEFGNSK